MKKFSVLIFVTFFSILSFAQKKDIVVNESEEVVDKIRRVGLSIVLDVDKKIVDKLWSKKLKEFGKVKGSYTIEIASIPSVSSRCRVESVVSKTNNGTKVWWAIDMGSAHVTKGGAGYSGAEKIMYDFGIECYREQVQEEIEEAQKALEDAQKDLEKEIKEGEKMTSTMENNKETIEKLEADNVQLEKDIAQNKQDQTAQNDIIGQRQTDLKKVQEKLAAIK